MILMREAVSVAKVLPDLSAEPDECAEIAEATRRCAEGVIVGLRRCSLESASQELMHVSSQHGLNPYRIARALVRLAQEIDPECDSAATSVARYAWGALLPRRDTRQHGRPLAVLG
jgi:hypothetical protein